MNPRKVSILCSNLKGNLGDFAIVEALTLAIKRYLGEAFQIDLYYHANKAIDSVRLQAFMAEAKFELKNIHPAPHYRRPWWLRLLCRSGLWQAHYSRYHNSAIVRVAGEIRNQQDFFQAVALKSDLILFSGGAQWGRGDLNLNMFAQLQAVALGHCPVRVFPFSLSEATLNCNGLEGLKRLFQALDSPIFVRDGITHQALATAEISSELVSDCVFSLLRQFNSRWDAQSPEAGQSRRVYISLTESGDTDVASMSALIRSLKEASLHPILFSTCEVEDRNFYQAVQDVVEVDAVYPISWKQALSLLSCCRYVITNRLHCTIFSALSGTPVIPVTNRSKSKAYVRDAALPCSLSEVGAIAPAQLEGFDQKLGLISARQTAYASACFNILEARLPELFALKPETN
jgi:polysaccharide pyruvyl transferase WcaK-like protein